MQCVHWYWSSKNWKLRSIARYTYFSFTGCKQDWCFDFKFFLPGIFIVECDPRMQVMADLSSKNVNWHLSQLIVLEYGCALFTDWNAVNCTWLHEVRDCGSLTHTSCCWDNKRCKRPMLYFSHSFLVPSPLLILVPLIHCFQGRVGDAWHKTVINTEHSLGTQKRQGNGMLVSPIFS